MWAYESVSLKENMKMNACWLQSMQTEKATRLILMPDAEPQLI